MHELFWQINNQAQSVIHLITDFQIIVNVLLAGGLARDLGNRNRNSLPILFMPQFAWIIATLIQGVMITFFYWIVHYYKSQN